MRTPKTKQEIIPPSNGWVEHGYYIVEAAFSETNPVHTYLFYTGFLNEGKPCGYNEILDVEDFSDISSVVYLRALRLLYVEIDEVKTPNQYCLLRELKDRTPVFCI